MCALVSRVALVTGSTSGIGLGVARALACAGATVVLHGLASDAEAEAAVAAVLGPSRHDHRWCGRHDLRAPGAAVELLDFAARVAGRAPDILVNNAGLQRVAPIVELADDAWDEVLEVNLSAAFRLTRGALPPMLARRWGRIVNISSIHGKVGSVHKAAYVAAKHGLLGLTKVTALEAAGSGVTCSAICPGWVRTPLVQAQVDALGRERGLAPAEAEAALLREKQPSAEFVPVEAIGQLALLLCSDAGRHLTGECVSIDGGWGAR